MLFYLSLFLCSYVVYRLFRAYWGLRKNVAIAKRSGLPYRIVPMYFLERWWLASHPLWLRLLKHLPDQYTQWVDFCLPDSNWHYRYDLFQRVGHDTFLTVSPTKLVMFTAEPSVINQITTRRNDFPKPTYLYRSINIYGPNVIGSEGQVWRHHRKAVSPPFTEKNNHLVWTESIDQAQAMLASWLGPDGKGNKSVDRIMDDTMRLSLHVISNAGFGRKIQWPTQESQSHTDNPYYDDSSKIKNESEDVEPGHTMSYAYAMHCLLENIFFQFLFPRWFLKYSPFRQLRKANECYHEFGAYMAGMASERKRQYHQRDTVRNEGLDILAQLVKGQVAEAEVKGSQQYLTDSEILGNMFVLIVAGHETTANSIHFVLLYLAMHIPSQRRLQQDLDRIFQGRPPAEWDYERDLPALFGGMAGAVLAEELRLVPPVATIPKSTTGVPDQTLVVEGGKKVTVPADTYIPVCTAAVHRHPNHWPSGPPTRPGGDPAHPVSNLDNDLEEFRPERWLLQQPRETDPVGTGEGRSSSSSKVLLQEEKLDGEGMGINLSSDTSESLYKPPRGAYIPFSDGYRSCLGRRFAQVEVLAVLAVIFQHHSVELDVDASDADVATMTEQAKAEIWHRSARRCRNLLLHGCATLITLQMRQGTVKLRFVPRGAERFPDHVDTIGNENVVPSRPENPSLGDPRWKAWDPRTWREWEKLDY